MDNPVQIEWSSQKNGLAQIYRSGLEYSFVSKDNKQCHQFAFCKDFLQDAVRATLTNGTASIYGFTYTPSNMPHIDLENVKLCLANSADTKFLSKKENVLDFINQFEKLIHLKRTIIYDVANPESKYKKCGCLLFVGSPRWLESPPMLSLYTLMVRIGFVHTKGNNWRDTVNNVINGKIKPYQTNDKNYISSSIVGIDKIVKIGYRAFFYKDINKNYPKDISISSLHNSTGIVAFSSQATPVKYWQRKSLQKRLSSKQPSQGV